MTDLEEMIDPRLRPDFRPEYLPLCDGGLLPPVNPADMHLRRVIAFASVYYAMNQALAAAEAARSADDASAEHEALRRFCGLSAQRDALEDRLTPEGFLAEPFLSDGLYVNLAFTWSGKPDPVLCARRFEAMFTL